jgi:hypothetical protein
VDATADGSIADSLVVSSLTNTDFLLGNFESGFEFIGTLGCADEMQEGNFENDTELQVQGAICGLCGDDVESSRLLQRNIYSLVDTRYDDSNDRVVVIDTTHLYGKYPRHYLASFLPVMAVAEAGEDKRACVSDKIFPKKVTHVLDDRGENFVVEYAQPVLCQDGLKRRKVFYQCRSKRHVVAGSPEHQAGHAIAEERAWAHVEQVVKAGGEAEDVDLRFGKGPLYGNGSFRHHGDEHEDWCFHVHPKKPDWKIRSNDLEAATRYLRQGA